MFVFFVTSDTQLFKCPCFSSTEATAVTKTTWMCRMATGMMRWTTAARHGPGSFQDLRLQAGRALNETRTLAPQKFSSWLLRLSCNFGPVSFREAHWARDRGRTNPQEPMTIESRDPHRYRRHGSVASGIVLIRSPSAPSTTYSRPGLGADGNTDCGHGRHDYMERDEFSFGNRGGVVDWDAEEGDEKAAAVAGGEANAVAAPMAMPSMSVMTRLILIMVRRKLIRNPNTYSSLIGVIWSLVCFRWNFEMPAIVLQSISILSDAGLGMAMFSLGRAPIPALVFVIVSSYCCVRVDTVRVGR